MFSVYGVTGQTFRGTLENLSGVNALPRADPVSDILRGLVTEPPLSLWA